MCYMYSTTTEFDHSYIIDLVLSVAMVTSHVGLYIS